MAQRYVPACYEPRYGYMYQIMFRPVGNSQWEPLGWAENDEACANMMAEFRGRYPWPRFYVQTMRLPRRFWKEKADGS